MAKDIQITGESDVTEAQGEQEKPSVCAVLERLQGVVDAVRTDIEAAGEQGYFLPPAEIIPAPEIGPTDFLARPIGTDYPKAFIWRDGRPVEVDREGGDVCNTYDLWLKQLEAEEETDLRRILDELGDLRNHLAAIECMPARAEEAEKTTARIDLLDDRVKAMRPDLEAKRLQIEEGILKLPLGKVLFLRISNSEYLYPVIIVEHDGMKWVELIGEITPSGLGGQVHPPGFRIPLRNCSSNGDLFLPMGMIHRDDTSISDGSFSLVLSK